GRQASRLTLLSEEVRICALWIGSSICIGGRNAHRPQERRSRRVGNRTREEKRRPGLTEKVSRQRQHVKDGEAPANGRLPIAARSGLGCGRRASHLGYIPRRESTGSPVGKLAEALPRRTWGD